MEVVAIVCLFVVIAIVVRLLAGGMDHDRVGEYIRSQGGEVIDQHWSPFGRGWFGEKNDRIYEVRYRDREGNIREATVKTSMFSGVYLTGDRLVETAQQDRSSDDDLARENERLRQRIAELEKKSCREDV